MLHNKKNKIIILLIITVIIIMATIIILIANNNMKEQKAKVIDGILVSEKVIGNIPVIEYTSLVNTKTKPLIIMQHGLTADKTAMKPLALFYASQGFFVVTPDAYAHGQYHVDGRILIMDIITETAESFNEIIEYYDNFKNIDSSNFGLLGFSLGGMASYYYCANGKYTPKIVGVISSTPYWEELSDTNIFYTTYGKKKLRPVKEEIKEEIKISLKNNSPYDELLIASNDTSFFIINGSEDKTIPFSGCNLFYNEFSKNNPGKIELHIVEGMGHNISDNIEDLLFSMFNFYKKALFN